MMKNNEVNYIQSQSGAIEIIYQSNSYITYPDHNHISIYTIGIILSGNIRVKQKNHVTEYRRDDFFVIPPYEPHNVQPVLGPYSLLTVCVKENFVKSYNSEEVVALFQELSEFLRKKGLLTLEQICVFSMTLKTILERLPYPEKNIDKTIEVSKEILKNDTENTVNIEDLSQSLYVSRYHFIRKFKELVGLSPYRFQLQNRIRKAQQLLIQGNNITEVALVTGFYDQSHFIKSFKKIVGLTPSTYMASITIIPEKINKGPE